ncbi:MAG: ATP-binding cassette domain-containing protein [Anaerolineae bacterium]|nr:ATP-binding cassette domain-containing protein [Anaerolineae bacterium]
MSNQQVIQTQALSKVYKSGKKETLVLDNLTLDIHKGEIFGYLGPNGAGKTTTIRLLLDLIRPTGGSATILGKDIRADSVEIHRRIGFLPGELALWKNRTRYAGHQLYCQCARWCSATNEGSHNIG